MLNTSLNGLSETEYSQEVKGLFLLKPPGAVKIAASLFIFILILLFWISIQIRFPEQLYTYAMIKSSLATQAQVLEVSIPEEFANSITSATDISVKINTMSGFDVIISKAHLVGFLLPSTHSRQRLAKIELPSGYNTIVNCKSNTGQGLKVPVTLILNETFFSKIFPNSKK